MHHIDLNADIGEGFPYDAKLLQYITSCNIACGGHAGSFDSITKTIHLAQKHDVNIGAHPSYPDKDNFGRKSLDISNEDLIINIHEQLKLFESCIEASNSTWKHIKFHGALYNDLKYDRSKAEAIVDYLHEHQPNKALFVPPNSEIRKEASKKIPFKIEGFADRAYNEDLSLVPRNVEGAVLLDAEMVVDQVISMVLNQQVKTISGEHKKFKVETICLHGDTPSALNLVKSIAKSLQKRQIIVQ
jgi:UPF0271 protein